MEPVAQVPCTVVIPYNYLNLIIPIATIIAAVIGGWWVSRINKANSIRAAKYDFLGSILECFEGVYPSITGSNTEIFTILRNAYPRINVAVHKLRSYIPDSEITGYSKAWEDYEEWYKNTNETSMKVHVFYGEGDCPYKVLCGHIEILLSYAK